MGTLFHFDQVMAAHDARARKSKRPRRQVELFERGGRLYLRIGPLGAVETGAGFIVELTQAQAEGLLEGLSLAFCGLWGEEPPVAAWP